MSGIFSVYLKKIMPARGPRKDLTWIIRKFSKQSAINHSHYDGPAKEDVGGFRVEWPRTTLMQNHMEKNMDNETETGVIRGL